MTPSFPSLPTALLAALLQIAAFAQPGTVDPLFNPALGMSAPSISAMARQPDGKILLAGQFFPAGGFSEQGLVRLNYDGSLDPTFAPERYASIFDLAVQPDGKILIAGFVSRPSPPESLYLARLHSHGSRDETFGQALSAPVFQVLVQADGRILVRTVHGLRRLNPDGTHDADFNIEHGAGFTANAIALLGDGRIIAGGSIAIGGLPQAELLRLFADGNIDPTYQPVVAAMSIGAVALYPDGRLLVQATVRIAPAQTQSLVLRLLSNGHPDPSFIPRNVSIGAALIQAGDKVIGGNPMIRLAANGSEDDSFVAVPVLRTGGIAGSIRSWEVEGDGSILVAGQFDTVSGVARQSIARILNDVSSQGGTVEFTVAFKEIAEAEGRTTLAVRRTGGTNGHVSVSFAASPGTASPHYDFVPVSGTIDFADGEAGEKQIELIIHDDLYVEPDETFTVALANPLGGAVLGSPASTTVLIRDNDIDFNFTVEDLPVGERAGVLPVTVQRSGQLDPAWVELTTYDSTAKSPADYTAVRKWIRFEQGELEQTIELSIRDNPWGEPDEEFQIYLWQRVGSALFRETDSARVHIIDDDRPGSVDPSFNPGTGPTLSDGSPGRLEALLIQDDGKILAGGRFSSFNGISAGSLVRLNPNGSVDLGFDIGSGATFGEAIPNEPGLILSLTSQADGKLLVGGRFWDFNGLSRTGLVRLNPGGSVDDTLDLGGGITDDASMEFIHAIAVQPDQSIVVAWKRLHPNVTDVAPAYGVLRVLSDGRRDPSFGQNGIVLVDPSNVIIFAPHAQLGVSTLGLQPDGSILLGGQFLGLMGTPAGGIARLLTNGLWDPAFNVGSGTRPPGGEGLEGIVKSIHRQPDGRLLVGGFYSWLNDRPALSLARLRENGAFDESFQPQVGLWGEDFNWMDNSPLSSGISDFALQSSGQIIVAGKFYRLNAEGQQDNFSNPINLARLNSDGSIDPHFYSAVPVRRMAVHPDASIIVIGDFDPGIARLNGGQPLKLNAVRPSASAGGSLRLSITAPVAHTYLLLASPDLVTWWVRQTLTLEAGTYEIEVPAQTTPGREFFKVLAIEL